MKASIAAAALGAAVLSQAATIGHSHGHQHLHKKQVEKRASTVPFLNAADAARLAALGVNAGNNALTAATGPAYISGGGSYVVEVQNTAAVPVIFTVWTASPFDNQKYLASFPARQTLDITHSIPAGGSAWISLNPEFNSSYAGQLSGGWAALYPSTGLSDAGQIDNTWGEFTVVSSGGQATTDVSRLVNMNGNNMVIDNHTCKDDAEKGIIACTANMNQCAYQCEGGALSCFETYTLVGCAAGSRNTNSDAAGQNGGCAGMPDNTGYIVVTLS